jgi:hypothetical protein
MTTTPTLALLGKCAGTTLRLLNYHPLQKFKLREIDEFNYLIYILTRHDVWAQTPP